MSAFRYVLFLMIVPFTGSAQSTNLIFQGHQEFRDTLQFSMDTLDLADMNHSRVFNIPANEVWVIDQSRMSFQISNSSVYSGYYSTSCNCISLDGIVLHNILNGDGKSHDWKTFYYEKYIPVFTNVPNAAVRRGTMGGIGILFGGIKGSSSNFYGRPFGDDRLPRQISETFDTRLKLLSGVHEIFGNVIITDKDYSQTVISDPYWDPGAAYIIHTILFEKYTIE